MIGLLSITASGADERKRKVLGKNVTKQDSSSKVIK